MTWKSVLKRALFPFLYGKKVFLKNINMLCYNKNMVKKQKREIYKKWYFWVIMAVVLVLIGTIVIFYLNNSDSTRKVTICTEMDYHGDIGPCTKTKVVEIVAVPENGSSCPTNTEPVYDVVGGFVGLEFVGCTTSK